MRNIIIASTSTIHCSGYLEYILDDLKVFFKNANTILFIPYARPGGLSHNDYTEIANNAFNKINKKVKGIHEFENPNEAIKNAEGIFMPIVYPPSFNAIGLVPFNINPHYLDPSSNSKHMGETRETRIKEFHSYNTQPVIGLREGSWLHVNHDSIILKGELTARVFEYNKAPYEVDSGTELNQLK